MGAFIAAAVIFFLTCIATLFVMFANGMSTTGIPSDDSTSPWTILIVGAVISCVVVLTHWLPPLGW